MLTCSRCGQPKPESEFYRNSAKPSGYSTWCKECGRTYFREYHRIHNGHAPRKLRTHGDMTAVLLAPLRAKIAEQMGLDEAPQGCEKCPRRVECEGLMLATWTNAPALCELSDREAGVDARVPTEDRRVKTKEPDYVMYME